MYAHNSVSNHREILCAECGRVLLERKRNGAVSAKTMKVSGNTAVLTCDCGYTKTIKNPFMGAPRHG
jgi:hypothetical protein